LKGNKLLLALAKQHFDINYTITTSIKTRTSCFSYDKNVFLNTSVTAASTVILLYATDAKNIKIPPAQ
jgi:hypothetical protein